MNKKLKILIDRLDRIFPHLKLYYEGETFTSEIRHKSGKMSHLEIIESQGEVDFAPPMEYDWYDIIKILNENGLEIRNKKDN